MNELTLLSPPPPPNFIEGAIDTLVADFVGGGLIFLERFGKDDRNRAIGLTNFAGNVLVAMGDGANDPGIIYRVGKMIVGEWHVHKTFVDESHPKFADDVQRFVELAKILERRRDVAIEHN